MFKKLTQSSSPEKYLICKDIDKNIMTIKKLMGGSADLVLRTMEVNKVKTALIMFDGMTNILAVHQRIVTTLKQCDFPAYNGKALFKTISENHLIANDVIEISTIDQGLKYAMGGFVMLLIDGVPRGYSLGMVGYSFRNVSEPTTEANLRGSKEGFTDILKINQTMIRRRLKSCDLRFEMAELGTVSKTDVCLVYVKGKASDTAINYVKQKLGEVKLESVLDSGYITPFLEQPPNSFFSTVGSTERPDVLCGKIMEGRIAILVDGTPFALVIPYLFTEHFQTMDDYCQRPFFVTFMRILKIIGFLFTTVFPGTYVAIVTFHPEMIPYSLMFTVAQADTGTPFSALFEALLLFFIYEVIREAGLRVPQSIGQAVSIVGAIVLGDAAISAGIIGAPMLIVVAITAICSYIVPSLYEEATIIRLLFVIIGGFTGILGLTLGVAVLGTNLCAKVVISIPHTAPLSPFSAADNKDVIYRASWKKHQQHRVVIRQMLPSPIKERQNED